MIFLCRYGILAPSGHNSQPWKLQVEDEGILIFVNKDHFISGKKSGLLTVEPYVSLGTFIENVELAARSYGYELFCKLFPNEKDAVAFISISRKRKQTVDHSFLDSIKQRVSNRNEFSVTPTPTKDITKIANHSYKSVESNVISARKDIELIADKTEVAIERIMSNIKYRKELGEWVRNNKTTKYDGMPGFTHGVKLLPSFVAKFGIVYASKLGPPASKSKNLIKHSSFLLVAGYTKDSEEAYINIGRYYSKTTIIATYLGYSSSALGAAVIDNKSREEVKRLLKLNYRPVVILRFGKSNRNGHHSPRWPLEDVLSRSMDDV